MPKVNKTTVETAKTVVIAVLITGVIAFMAGVHYEHNNNAQTQAAVKSATATVAKLK